MIATATKTETPQLTEDWHPEMPMEDYLALPAMSASGLWDFNTSPAHYLFARAHPKKQTPGMAEGTAVHTLVLEPELFDRYIVLGQCAGAIATGKNKGARCTNPGSRYRDGNAFCGVKGHDPEPDAPCCPDGYSIVTDDQLARMQGMVKAVHAHPEAAQLFKGCGRSEVVGVWQDKATGVWCKLRLDRQIERASIHADLKRTDSAAPEAFYRVARNLGYFLRCAFYRRGMEALGKPAGGSVLIAVEAEPRIDRGNGPEHACVTYLVEEAAVESWGREVERLLERYGECERAGIWPAFRDDLVPLECKPWDMPLNEHEKTLVDGSDYDPDAPLEF